MVDNLALEISHTKFCIHCTFPVELALLAANPTAKFEVIIFFLMILHKSKSAAKPFFVSQRAKSLVGA